MLHAVELGDPAHPTIVLLHGMGAGHQMWQPQLLPLSERYYVVAPDLPGCAGSISEGPFTLTGTASGVLTYADLQIIAGAGHVWNLQRPEQFTRLVLSFVQQVEAASAEP